MSSYNKVILMGNLTRDPEIRFTQSNVAICKFGLAVNRRFKDQTGEWREEATFVDITMFGKRGEAFAKFHTKGKSAFIEGELRFDTWEDQSGQKRSKLYVVGESWEFVGSGSRGQEGGGYGGQQSSSAPAQYQSQSQQSQSQQSQPQQSQPQQSQPQGDYGQPQPDYLEVDDTPF